LGHIVRKYFYEIPPRLPFLPAGRLFQREEKLCPPLGRVKKDYPPLGKGGKGGFENYLLTRTGGIPSSGETSLTRTGTVHSLSGFISILKIYIDCMA